MTELFWSIKVKLTAMLNDIKWTLFIRKYDLKSLKNFIFIVWDIVLIEAIIIFSDIVRFFNFIKSIISQKIIFIPLSIMFILFGIYLFFINGEPDSKFFNEKIFPKFYYDRAIAIYDGKDRFIGSIAQPQSKIDNPSLFIEKTPSLFWTLIKEKYDPKLDFDSNATSLYEAIFEHISYYNGIDIFEPFSQSKRLIEHLITKQNLELKSRLTLTQQLIKIFLRKYPLEQSNSNIARLKLAKTFFHKLKYNNGANFKSWLFGEKEFFLIDGKGYGLRDCAEIFFGKSLDELSKEEEIILVAMYEKPFNLNQSLKEQKRRWEEIKRDAIEITNNSKVVKKNHYRIVSNIKNMHFPKLPYFPDTLMEIVGEITSKNREEFSSLPTRSDALLQSAKAVLTQELDKLFKTYSISPKSRLITKIIINFKLDEIFYFNYYLKEQLESLNLPNIWVSVVNDRGEIVRLYQNGISQQPFEIGNLSKIFSTLLFVDRGDKYYTKYCDKKIKSELSTENGFSRCSSSSWIDARRLFASNKMLPLYDGFIKYREQNRRGDNIYYRPIYLNKIETLYQNLELVSLENDKPRVDLGLGKLKMTPLDMQRALHKITQLIYKPNRIFYGLKLIDSLEYHSINNGIINPKIKFFSFNSPEQITPTFQKFFTKKRRIILQTIFKTPIYKSYGSLQWLKNYISVKFIFAQESHKNGLHWLVGVFKKSNRYYSFTIFIKDNNSNKVKESIKKVLEATVKSITHKREMKFNYMKYIFRD